MFEEVKMRRFSLLILGTVLASCTANPNAPLPAYAQRTPSGQRAYETLLAGKAPAAPISCLPSYRANDMSVIDGQTLGFRLGTGTTYLVHLGPGCELLGTGTYALLSKQYGSPGMCRGDIQQVVDTLNRVNVGSCVITEIVPYYRQRA
jgi:hypothetical protein